MGVGSLLGSVFGGGKVGGSQGGGLGASSVYVPQNSAANDTSFQDLLKALTGQGAQGGTAANQVVNNPYTPGMQTAANAAGTSLNKVGNAATAGSQNVTQNANAAIPYGNQILDTAFDPQHNLYDRELQQTQDQARAASSAAGLGTSGVGVGMENQAVNNFNLDWQDRQLGRENQGIQGYDSLLSSILSSLTGGTNLGQQGATDVAQGGALPWQTANAGPEASLGALGQAQGLTQQSLADILSYLGIGTDASNAANTSAKQGYNNTEKVGSAIVQAAPSIIAALAAL